MVDGVVGFWIYGIVGGEGGLGGHFFDGFAGGGKGVGGEGSEDGGADGGALGGVGDLDGFFEDVGVDLDEVGVVMGEAAGGDEAGDRNAFFAEEFDDPADAAG